MVVAQGDVLWVELPPPAGSRRRPAVVLQHDRFNRSRLRTLVVAAVTSNLRLAAMPGNVRLARGEGGLPRPSVVNVTQIATIDREQVLGRAGTLTAARLANVWDGVRLVLEPRASDPMAR